MVGDVMVGRLLQNRIRELDAEVEALRKDKARLDYLETQIVSGPRVRDVHFSWMVSRRSFRKALDVALGANR